MDSLEKARLLASYEVGWWKAHHHKDFNRAVDMMAKEYALQFGIPYEQAKKAVELRVEAAKMHDKAEEYEDKKDRANANIYWKKAEDLLRQHFELIVSDS